MSAPASRGIVEIACDESGFVGGSLFSATRVFTHASVHLASPAAVAVMAEVRRRLGADASELKAARLNRTWARPVASWLLAPGGPLAGRAVVHVTDTRMFGLARLAQVLLSDVSPEGWWGPREDEQSWERALELHGVLSRLPPRCERALLIQGRNVLWLRRSRRHNISLDAWADAVRDAEDELADGEARRVLGALRSPAALARAGEYVATPPASPLTEPLLPALRWTVRHWSALGEVEVVHDEQSVLTPARVRAIAAELESSYPGRRMTGLRRVDSRDDPRVQVADLVAGVVRRVVEDDLADVADGPALPIAHLVSGDLPQRSSRKNTSQSRSAAGTS